MHENNQFTDVIAEKLEDLSVPRFVVEVSPIEAELMGAFVEEALSEADAWEAADD